MKNDYQWIAATTLCSWQALPVAPRNDVVFSIFYITAMILRITLSAIVLCVLTAFTLLGCADEASLNEISRLEGENAVLQGKVDSLQKSLDSITAYGDSVKKSLQKLDMHP